MINRLISLLFLVSVCTSVFAIGDKDSIPQEKPLPTEQVYGPTVGLGVGMLKFYGDILDANYGNPLVSNIGYELHVKQRINSFLTTKFYVLFGKVSANERNTERNLNFQSQLTVGGFALEYDFKNLLPKNKVFTPYLTLGIESVEFLSKTDLFDEFGNEYNYWSDGSIRNIAETDPNAVDAIVIQRDYKFETDLRESNFDGKGKYPERTFAVPFGAGVILHMSKNIDFTVGASMHFTFSDLVDNVVSESGGERIGGQEGNSGNDKFLMSSFSISYNFLKDKKEKEIKDFGEPGDYSLFADEDEDGDGVNDFVDKCAWTPPGVEVDSNGCPLDKDNDFVPNYKDDELETREFAPVSPNGVELTDEMIYIAYQRYMDSTGVFADTETRIISAEKRKKTAKRYKVQVGAYTEAIDADLVDKFLSIPDVEIKVFGDSLTIIAVGDYDNLPDAVKRKMQLSQEGYDAAIVVEEEKDGTLKSVGDEANNMNVDNVTSSNINSTGLIFRVQLGAFSKRLPKSSFNGLKNVMEIKADDGLYKYLYTGSFKTVEEAAGTKIGLAIDYGVKDAFIVAYKDGKRISLQDAGVNSTAVEMDLPKESKGFDKAKIKFKVQIGSYKNQLPTEVLSRFMELDGIEQQSIENGLTRYTAGSFTTYEEAEAFKKELAEKGFGGAFVISLHNEEVIPIKKAKEIIAE
jgi:cell division protein FtsN